jgi:hypothetical protein
MQRSRNAMRLSGDAKLPVEPPPKIRSGTRFAQELRSLRRNIKRGDGLPEEPRMSFDFEKQIREMQKASSPVARDTGQLPPTPVAVEESSDPTAVHFPLQLWVLAIHILGVLGFGGWILYAAYIGTLDQSLSPVFMGGAGMLFLLGLLPSSLTVDRAGVHQSHFLGLWIRTIPFSDVSFYWRTTRGELRKAGLLRFQSKRAGRQKNDHEEVVYVGSKSSRMYLLHSPVHSRRESFIAELEKRGAHPKGYEGWEAFMAARGVPVR